MVGGGLYALVGKVAGTSGMLAPLAFLLAATVAFFSALSFSELSARFPASAGESRYVHEAFGRPRLSQVIGWLVVATGVVSAATLADATVGFLLDLVEAHPTMLLVLVVVLLSTIAAWGITESVMVAGVVTAIEVGTLVVIVAVRGDVLATLPERWGELLPRGSMTEGVAVLAGGFLAFYSYLGFEDMVNVAEEVKEPRRNLPRGILMALGITTVLYLAITLVAVLAVPTDQLAAARTPLALVLGDASRASRDALVIVSLLAGVNGALVQIIMAARVIYGMAQEGRAPRALGVVSARTRTPVRATVLIGLVVLVLAAAFPLVALARVTSAIILVVFTVVNVALFVIKQRAPEPPPGAPRFPAVVPVVGAALCASLVGFQLVRWIGAA
jgi:amino acid transporter